MLNLLLSKIDRNPPGLNEYSPKKAVYDLYDVKDDPTVPNMIGDHNIKKRVQRS
ncbi:hypothetical protein [Siminovitchia fordii]|uniref:hypothetical protein n=1 Tax=Siminovitchia fordii TaxID=254759 RepID=UPI00037A7FCA|nr:hypothetical protein [Siminovitchia fordii]